jgi:hypothetical protein
MEDPAVMLLVLLLAVPVVPAVLMPLSCVIRPPDGGLLNKTSLVCDWGWCREVLNETNPKSISLTKVALAFVSDETTAGTNALELNAVELPIPAPAGTLATPVVPEEVPIFPYKIAGDAALPA